MSTYKSDEIRVLIDTRITEIMARYGRGVIPGTTASNIAPVPSSGGAPSNAQYLTLTTDATLTAERTLAAGAGLTGTDGGAGAAYTLAVGAGAGLTVNADDVALTTPGTLTVSTSNAATGNHTHAVTSSSNPGANARLLATDASGYLSLVRLTATDRVVSPLITSASGNITLTPASTSVILSDSRAIATTTFASGFTGSGFRIDQGISYASQTTAEFDNLIVRGLMRVYELVINKIRVSRGSLIVSPGGGKVASVSGSGPYTLNFEDDHGLAANDLLRAQKFTGSGTYQSLMTVSSVTDSDTVVATLDSGSAPAAGYEYAVTGNTSNAARRGVLYLTADDSGSPFMDIVAGLSAHSGASGWGSASLFRTRVGRLDGITSGTNEYGLYAGDGTASTDQYIRVSNSAVLLNNVPIQLYNGGNQTVNIDSAGTDIWVGASTSDRRLTWDGSNLRIVGSAIIGPNTGFAIAPIIYCGYDAAGGDSKPNLNGHRGQQCTSVGTVSGTGSAFGNGNVYGSVAANGGNAFIYPAASSYLRATGSVGVWIYSNSVSTTRALFTGHASGTIAVFLDASNNLKVARKDTEDVVVVASGITTTSSWRHVCATWSGRTVTVYVDGAQLAQATASADFADPANIVVGAYDTSATYPALSSIDDFFVSDFVLTADQVRAIYTSRGPLVVTRSNHELLLTASGVGSVSANAGGIFGTDSGNKPTFTLLNSSATVNGESLGAGDTLLGDNSSSKGNVLFDQSAGTLNIRNGTTNVIQMYTDATAGTVANIEGAIKLGASGGIWQGSSGSFSSPNTGLKIYRNASDGWIELWNGGTKRIQLDPNNGVLIESDTAFSGTRALNFYNVGQSTRIGDVYGYTVSGTPNGNNIVMRAYSTSAGTSANAIVFAGNSASGTSTSAPGVGQFAIFACKMTEPNTADKPRARGVFKADSYANSVDIQFYAEANAGDTASITINADDGASTIAVVADNINFTGTKSGFIIDHPLDPENKWLVHTPVESDRLRVVYDGEVTLNDAGAAVVTMPEWFAPLAKNVRVMVSCVDAHMPVYVTDIRARGFTIAGGTGGRRVFWTLSAERADPWAEQRPLAIETDKPADERGTLFAWREYGASEIKSWRRRTQEKLKAKE